MRASGPKRGRRAAPPAISARLCGYVTLETHANGKIVACIDGHSVGVGTASPGAMARALELRTGLPLGSFASDGPDLDREIGRLIRRLATHGLLEYRFGPAANGEDQVVIEPQRADYWPRTPELDNADVVVLSRFAYLRRRGDAMVLESPRSGALFRICDWRIAAAMAKLSTPQRIEQLRCDDDFPGVELLALLLDCQILFRTETARDGGFRTAEGDGNLALWDFHDLLFHTRSSEGRQANPAGGLYPYAHVMAPLPAVRPPWPGHKVDLGKAAAADSISAVEKLLRRRHSTRSFDDQRPVTLAELARFLDSTARVLSSCSNRADLGDAAPMVSYTVRPYPSAGASYELELYLAVNHCQGLARGFYHYDAGGHALAAIGANNQELEALLTSAQFAIGAAAAPPLLITIAARFGRVSWKYSSIAYALILKDVGVLLQTFYLIAADMGLGGCAVGSVNIDLFEKITGIEFHVEGPVGQFALGRGADREAPQ